jgi:hypothetical protein
MKYKIITIAILMVFGFLYATRNVSAIVHENSTPPSDYLKVTGENISDGSMGNIRCTTTFYGNAIGKDLRPMQKVVCK